MEDEATSSVSGQFDWGISVRSLQVIDLNLDGDLDLLLVYNADDDPTDPTEADRRIGPPTSRVGVVWGPVVGDSEPTALIEGSESPFRSPDVLPFPQVYDFDGDGVMDLLVPFRETEQEVPWVVVESPNDPPTSPITYTQASAWYRGPFFGDARLMDGSDFYRAPHDVHSGDADQNGSRDLLVLSQAEPDAFSYLYFTGAASPVSEAIAQAKLVFPEKGQLWSAESGSSVERHFWGTTAGPAGLQQVARKEIIGTLDWKSGGTVALKPVFESESEHTTIALLGDVDNDGKDDAQFWAPGPNASDPVVFDGFATPAPPAVATFGGFPSDAILRSAGDINNDGAVDLLLSAGLPVDEWPEPTCVPLQHWILFGPLLERDYGVSDAAGVIAGRRVEPLGDVDGDSFDDLGVDHAGWPDRIEPQHLHRHPGRVWILDGQHLTNMMCE